MKITFTLAETQAAARQFLQAVGQLGVIAFHGAMGAGKTTFIRALCQELGVQDIVTSTNTPLPVDPFITSISIACASRRRHSTSGWKNTSRAVAPA